MIMMNGDSPVPGSSPSLPVSASLPTSSSHVDPQQLANGPPPCTGCGQPIQDEFILRVQGQLWHAQCLCCAACQRSLSHTCYVRGSRVFCRMDFFRLFGASCAGCGEVIPPSEVVRTAQENIYHIHCFLCVLCRQPLHTGDHFYLRDDGQLICKADYHRTTTDAAAAPPENHDCNGQDMCQTQPPPPQQPPPPPPPPPPPVPQPSQSLPTLNGLTFTPQETEVLQEMYRACPSPSPEMVQRLSSQMGLEAAKVRVWFHRHRKHRHLPQAAMAGYGAGTGPGAVSGAGVGDGGMKRAAAPPGGYPLPIVNEVGATSSGRLPPSSSRSDVAADLPAPFSPLSSPPSSSASGSGPGGGVPCQWPLPEDVWRWDFVPPNVDLKPGDIENGEVCGLRRGLPSTLLHLPQHPVTSSSTSSTSSSSSSPPQQFSFMPPVSVGVAGPRRDCQQDLAQQQHGPGPATATGGEVGGMAMSWINS